MDGFADINGTSLFFEVQGEGSPLVLISGGGTLDRRAWDDQVQAFAKHHRVMRYDIRGIGKSARPTGAFSHSQDLAALLSFLELQKAIIVGLSFSSAIALDFALDHPHMVDCLVLAASGTSSDALSEANLQGLSMLSTLASTDGVERVIQLILDTPSFLSPDNHGVRDRVRQIYLDNQDVFTSAFPLVRLWTPTHPPASGRLAAVRARTLIVEGERDDPGYKSTTAKLLAIPGARKVEIAGAAHAINLDKPREFNEVVLEELNSVRG